MLQYPTNVYPDGATFDALLQNDDNKVEFTFNGDFFTGAVYKVYNYDTGELVKTGAIGNGDQTANGYNGSDIKYQDIFGYEGNNPLTNGSSYVIQFQLFQYTPDGQNPLYDMFALRGNIQEDYDSTNDYVVVKDKIPNIYEWAYDDQARYPSHIPYGTGRIAGGMQIVINGEKREIVAYNPTNGHLMIDPNTPFTSPISAGDKYQIYSNYIITQPYYFQCRSTPSVDLDMEFVNVGTVGDMGIKFHVTGTYSQSEGSLINYYRIKLQWNWDTEAYLAPWRDLDETEKIYSQKIEYDFFDDFILRYKRIVNGNIRDISATAMGDIAYRAVIEVVTANGKTIIANSEPIFDYRDETNVPPTKFQTFLTFDEDAPDVYYPNSVDAAIQVTSHNLKHIITIRANVAPINYIVANDAERFALSSDVVQNDDVVYVEDTEIKYLVIDNTQLNSENGYREFGEFPENFKRTYYRENLDTGEIRLLESVTDVTVPTRGHFKYYETIRKLTDGDTYRYVKGISSDEITLDGTQMRGCSITELLPYDEPYQWGTRKRYYIGDQWKFVGDIQDTTITQNMDKYAHVGYGTYPQITSTKTCYLSGTISAMNGYVDCTTKKYTDTIDLVRAWRQFVSRQAIYMLKTQKGDVLVVGVVDNPTTTYGESIKEIPTTFSFSWVELCDISDIKVDYEFSTHPDRPI